MLITGSFVCPATVPQALNNYTDFSPLSHLSFVMFCKKSKSVKPASLCLTCNSILQICPSLPQRIIIQNLENPQHEMPVSQPAEEFRKQGGQSFGDFGHGCCRGEIYFVTIELEDISSYFIILAFCDSIMPGINSRNPICAMPIYSASWDGKWTGSGSGMIEAKSTSRWSILNL